MKSSSPESDKGLDRISVGVFPRTVTCDGTSNLFWGSFGWFDAGGVRREIGGVAAGVKSIKNESFQSEPLAFSISWFVPLRHWFVECSRRRSLHFNMVNLCASAILSNELLRGKSVSAGLEFAVDLREFFLRFLRDSWLEEFWARIPDLISTFESGI